MHSWKLDFIGSFKKKNLKGQTHSSLIHMRQVVTEVIYLLNCLVFSPWEHRKAICQDSLLLILVPCAWFLTSIIWIAMCIIPITGSYNGTCNCLSVQFSLVTQSCPTLCDPMNCSTPGLPVHHWLLELTQTHVHWVGEAIQPSYPLSSPSPPAFNLSQHQGLFKWVRSSHQVAKILEFQL